MSGLRIGTAGIPATSQPPTTIGGIRRLAELGLGVMEMEFVQNVYLNEAQAAEVAKVAVENNISLSAHASYYINFNAREPAKLKASQKRLLHAAKIAAICGAKNIVFHAGFYMGDSPEDAYQKVKFYLSKVAATLKEENVPVILRPEVSGKLSQFGSLEELLRLCREVDGLAPAIDFAHWHARTGANNTYEEFTAVLKQVEKELGASALKDLHIHAAGIAYGARGEIKHLNLEDSDLKYGELMAALADCDAGGLLICESPNREEDALRLKAAFHSK